MKSLKNGLGRRLECEGENDKVEQMLHLIVILMK